MSLRSAAALACAFAALAVLVATGALDGVDQWAVDHLMPGASPSASEPTIVESLVPLLGADWGSPLAIAVDLVTLPAALLISFAIVAARSRMLAVMLVAAVAVEVVCKETLTRPALYDGAAHIVPFDSSFPSGHSLRSVLVAAALWPVLRWWGVAWAAASLVLLELAGWHTPTDIAGGVLLAALALLGARAAGALRARRLARA